MNNVLTTIVLHYGGTTVGAGSATCQVEHDEILDTVKNEDGETVEKTSFAPGDVYHFLVKCADGIQVLRIKSTWGDISYLGSVSRTRENGCLFVELDSRDNKPSVSYKPSGSHSPEWIGNVGGPVYIDNKELLANIKTGIVPCFCNLSYPVSFDSYRLSHSALDLDSYEIYIIVYLGDIE